jgi:RNA-directed DNA polymerase
MHGRDQSDPPVVAEKSANNAEQSAAESMERRGGAKGKAISSSTRRAQNWESVSPGLGRLRQFVKVNRNVCLTTLLHHVNADLLRWAYFALNRDAAAGIDGRRWEAYGEGLEANLADLHARVHRGAYRALPSRRRMIPKPDGRERPLGIASIEDKIVQRAMVEVLNSVYEPEFLGFSYGFRPGRSQHDALDALWVGISNTAVNWIVDADIRSFFDTVNHDWLIRFIEHLITDRRILRLIRKWLKVGVLEGAVPTASESGTPQGAVTRRCWQTCISTTSSISGLSNGVTETRMETGLPSGTPTIWSQDSNMRLMPEHFWQTCGLASRRSGLSFIPRKRA